MRSKLGGHLIAFLIAWLAICAPSFAATPDPAAVQFFESKIRPLLAENCYKCHGPEKQKGGLRLDSRNALIQGGELGTVLVPGKTEESLIIKAIGYKDADLQMPPKKKLTDRQIADLTQWVKLGAPWPGEDKPLGPTAVPAKAMQITDADRAYWAFQPIRRPLEPAIKNKAFVANPIDAFILAGLEAKQIEPNSPASMRELIRRAYFDLIGLPPTPEEVDAFAKDESADAYEKLLDRLLAKPQYGERWARYWLDVVRYAQTNGYERDDEKPMAWRYRDYVIKALNEDKPYNRFIIEQLAGDEMPSPTNDSITATGFYRLCVWDDEPDDKRAADFDYLDDSIRTTSAAFLGLTIGCARCHDHKFDPISQADYYQLLACINNIRPHEAPQYALNSATYSPLTNRAAAERWFTEHDGRIKQMSTQIEALQKSARVVLFRERLAKLPPEQVEAYLRAKPEEQHKIAEKAFKDATPSAEDIRKALDPKSREQLQQLELQFKKVTNEQPPFDWALSIRDAGPTPRNAHVLVRGNASTPGPEVQPAFLTVLGGQKPNPLPTAESTGLRRALAEWIASPTHPLTARVMVNRIWQHHFGRGIVRTPDDFGKTGLAPTHPELLDWLASRFIEDGWSMKRMHKLIMMSSVYRMSSSAANTRAAQLDPANDLFWRQNMRRLQAEAIRDSILAVSGALNSKMGGRGFFPRLSREAIAGASRPGHGWDMSTEDERNRRSIYAFIKRSMLPPLFESFDYSNVSLPSGLRPETTVAPQALMLLNDDFLQLQADAFAQRVRADAGADPRDQIRRAYSLALGRLPTEREMQVAYHYQQRQATAFEALQSRLTFRPDVPSSLTVVYLNQLKNEDFLSGPRKNWSYARGFWGGGYEGIYLVDPARGPFALYDSAPFADGQFQGRLMLHNASEQAALIIRGGIAGHLQTGYEFVFNPRAQTISLKRHDKEVVTLASVSLKFGPDEWHKFKIEAAGPRLCLWLDDAAKPRLDATDPKPLLTPGRVGVRTWGASLSVEDISIEFDGKSSLLAELHAQPDHAQNQAMASLCLLLLNLNEFVYVD
jgi:mono/diheme cytochrome c family protein